MLACAFWAAEAERRDFDRRVSEEEDWGKLRGRYGFFFRGEFGDGWGR